jgi:hypothetical protein
MMDERPPDTLARLEAEERLGMVELVHRVLDRGAVVAGDVVISVAGIDLVYVGLRVLLASAETMRRKDDEWASGRAGGVAPEGERGPDG